MAQPVRWGIFGVLIMLFLLQIQVAWILFSTLLLLSSRDWLVLELLESDFSDFWFYWHSWISVSVFWSHSGITGTLMIMALRCSQDAPQAESSYHQFSHWSSNRKFHLVNYGCLDKYCWALLKVVNMRLQNYPQFSSVFT